MWINEEDGDDDDDDVNDNDVRRSDLFSWRQSTKKIPCILAHLLILP